MNFQIVPWGIRKLLVWIKDTFNDPPIVITENGVSEDGSTLNDQIRLNYYRVITNLFIFYSVHVFLYTDCKN